MGVHSVQAEIAVLVTKIRVIVDELKTIEATLEVLSEGAPPSETESVEWLPAPGSPADSVQGVHILHGQTTYTTDPNTPCPKGGRWEKRDSVFLRHYEGREVQNMCLIERPLWELVKKGVVLDPCSERACDHLSDSPDQEEIQW